MSRSWGWGALLVLWCALAVAEEVAPAREEAFPVPEETTLDLLKRMSAAVHYLDYEGSVVYVHGDAVEAMRIVHSEQDGYEREQVIALTGPAHQIVRDNYTTTRFQPSRHAVLVEARHYGRSSPTLVSFDAAQVESSYEFRPGDPRRVAGRATRTVAIVPRNGDRYGYRLYIDAEYALPLKFDVVDNRGVISQLMFTNIDIRHESPAAISRAQSKSTEGIETQDSRAYEGPWRFNNIPPGFELEFFNGAAAPATAEHFVFTDGMATLSVYVENDDSPGVEGARRIGAVGVVGGRIAGHQVTVVGEMPPETLRRFFEGVALAQPGNDNG